MSELDQFNEIKAEIAHYVAPAMLAKVSDFESSNGALEAAKTIRGLKLKIEKQRKILVEPLNDRVKSVNEYCRQIGDPLDKAEAHLRTELNRFAAEQEAIKQAKLREAEAERQREIESLKAKQEAEKAALEETINMFGAGPEEAEAMNAALAEKAKTEQAIAKMEFQGRQHDIGELQIKGTRKNTKVRILDLEKIPRVFLIIEPNEKMLIAAHKGGQTVPGVEFYEEIAVSVGAKSRVTRAALESER